MSLRAKSQHLEKLATEKLFGAVRSRLHIILWLGENGVTCTEGSQRHLFVALQSTVLLVYTEGEFEAKNRCTGLFWSFRASFET